MPTAAAPAPPYSHPGRAWPHGRQHARRLARGGLPCTASIPPREHAMPWHRKPAWCCTTLCVRAVSATERRARGVADAAGRAHHRPDLAALEPVLRSGDVWLHGGKATTGFAGAPHGTGPHAAYGFVDCGVSGGIWWSGRRFCLMAGGDAAAIATLCRCSNAGTGARPRLAACRTERRWPLHQDGSQRHRIRDAGLCRRFALMAGKPICGST